MWRGIRFWWQIKVFLFKYKCWMNINAELLIHFLNCNIDLFDCFDHVSRTCCYDNAIYTCTCIYNYYYIDSLLLAVAWAVAYIVIFDSICLVYNCSLVYLYRYYGCGLVFPEAIDGCSIVDLGSGSGRDCFILSKLVGSTGTVTGVDMTTEQV